MLDFERIATRVLLGTLAGVVLVSFVITMRSDRVDPWLTDFVTLYTGAQEMTYDVDAQFAAQKALLDQFGKVERLLVYPYPPHLMLLMHPLTWLPYFDAHLLFATTQFALIVVGFTLINGRRLNGWLILLGSHCVFQGLLFGRYIGLTFLGFALLLLSVQRGWKGILPGLLLLSLKPQFLVYPAIWLVRQKKYRSPTLVGGALVLLVMLVSSYVIGFDEVLRWPDALRAAADFRDRGMDLRQAISIDVIVFAVWLVGMRALWSVHDIRLVLLMTLLLSPSLTTYDTSHLLLLLPLLPDRFVPLSLFALTPLVARVTREIMPGTIWLWLAVIGLALYVYAREEGVWEMAG